MQVGHAKLSEVSAWRDVMRGGYTNLSCTLRCTARGLLPASFRIGGVKQPAQFGSNVPLKHVRLVPERTPSKRIRSKRAAEA